MTQPHDSQEQAPAGNASGPRRLVLVTGLSGAGKSTALAALEDIGFTVVDNLPLAMLDGFVGPVGRDGERPGRAGRSLWESTSGHGISIRRPWKLPRGASWRAPISTPG